MSSISATASSTTPAQVWSARDTPHTDVGPARSVGLGLLFTAIAYAGLWVTREHAFSAMFFQKSPVLAVVPPVEVFLACWAIAILVLKYFMRRQQEQAFANRVLLQLPERITVREAASLIEQIEQASDHPRRSFLLHRVVRALAHFQYSGSRSEVASLLGSQSEIDGTVVNSSYTMLRVFIWAIPILGFIGTVVGLGEALAGFKDLNDIDRLQEQLLPITGGLGGAFQATFIALFCSILIMFPTSTAQRTELRLLTWVEDFCNEQLLRRLSGQSIGSDLENLHDLAGAMGAQFADSLATAIQKVTANLQENLAAQFQVSVDAHHQEFRQLQNTMAHVAQASTEIGTRLAALPHEVVAQLDTLPEHVAGRITAAYGEALARETQTIQQQLAETYDTQLGRAEALQKMIRSDTAALGEVSQHAKAIADATDAVAQRLDHLPQIIASPLEERLGQVFATFGATMDTVVATMQTTIGTSTRSTQELEALSQQLSQQFQAIATDVHAWVEVAQDTTTMVKVSLSATSHEISQSADAFRASLETVGQALVGSVRESQTSLVACAESLQVATEAICQLVKHVDARRELDTLHAAVARVSQLLNADGHMTTVETS